LFGRLDDAGGVSASQFACLQQINGQLSLDYAVRRKMLIQRLEVTLQSFLWSKTGCKTLSTEQLEKMVSSVISNRRQLSSVDCFHIFCVDAVSLSISLRRPLFFWLLLGEGAIAVFCAHLISFSFLD